MNSKQYFIILFCEIRLNNSHLFDTLWYILFYIQTFIVRAVGAMHKRIRKGPLCCNVSLSPEKYRCKKILLHLQVKFIVGVEKGYLLSIGRKHKVRTKPQDVGSAILTDGGQKRYTIRIFCLKYDTTHSVSKSYICNFSKTFAELLPKVYVYATLFWYTLGHLMHHAIFSGWRQAVFEKSCLILH